MSPRSKARKLPPKDGKEVPLKTQETSLNKATEDDSTNYSKTTKTTLFSLCILVIAFLVRDTSIFLSMEALLLGGSKPLSSSPRKSSIQSTLRPYYESDMVDIVPQRMLKNRACKRYVPEVESELVSIIDVMKEPPSSRKATNQLFLMLNGENRGLYVSWRGDSSCLFRAVETAARTLGIDDMNYQNGLKLMDQMGHAVSKAAEVEHANRILHILWDMQLWIWSGIHVGYVYHLENNVTLTTLSLNPPIFDVQYFFTEEEADEIMRQGREKLKRSEVYQSGKSSVRTSETAKLDESEFVRDFRRRSSAIARLPSPSFSEKLQLVRYHDGEFYRRHLDAYGGKDYVSPTQKNIFRYEDYIRWATWANKKILAADASRIPKEFLPGGELFPDPKDFDIFPTALLNLLLSYQTDAQFFKRYDMNYGGMGGWDAVLSAINSTLKGNTIEKKGSMYRLLHPDSHLSNFMLPHIIESWEEKLGKVAGFHYNQVKFETNGISQYFRWIRWAKERISELMAENKKNKEAKVAVEPLPKHILPSGDFYPSFHLSFQNLLVSFLLQDFAKSRENSRVTAPKWMNEEIYNWLYESQNGKDVLLVLLDSFPEFIQTVIHSWEKRFGTKRMKYKIPSQVKHIEPNRFATLFIYLNDVESGGETVFPFSPNKMPSTDGSPKQMAGSKSVMSECSEGLSVPARGLHASLFYVQDSNMEVDLRSWHGGCPPRKGIKWGSNSFLWNADAEEGRIAWT